MSERRAQIQLAHELPKTRRCALLDVARSTAYYEAEPLDEAGLEHLLRGMRIDQPNQVWATDVCYIPMAKGFMYLVAVMDWHSRRVLSWRVSNTLEPDFCVEALEEAIAKHGAPKIFNTDQGAQFTCEAFTGVLKEHGIAISMDGKGREV